jgi:ATP-dependent RNA helicase DDX60
MEKVLRANDDDVVVYVAPTKALVNQIAAEVQARFQKTYRYPGKSLYAIHTRDYRVNNPTQCQVLVTVPHILQIMLLSPSNAKTWAPRIKTIIFDEVHSIGQADDGVVWEQLLLMAPCQVIALSATVGNPGAFTDWLQASQKVVNIDLQMVQHNTRFSDLRKFVYSPSRISFEPLRPKPTLATLGLENAPGFEYLHPVVSLTNEKRGIPDDLALESKDCLLLYQAMKKHETDQFKLPDAASPSKAVPEYSIGKTDIIKWGEVLKSTLRSWMKVHSSPFKIVVSELGRDVQNAYDAEQSIRRELERKYLSLADQAMAEFNEIANTALPMVAQLHAADALPAILFNYDRAGCEHVANTILSQLIAAEKQWRASSSAWKTKVAEFEAWKKSKESKQLQKKLESAAKSKQKTKDDGEKLSKQDRSREQSDFTDLRFVGFEPSAPSAEFSFANEKVVDFDELRLIIKRLRWREIPETLIDAFRRGIGVHHAGMNRKV